MRPVCQFYIRGAPQVIDLWLNNVSNNSIVVFFAEIMGMYFTSMVWAAFKSLLGGCGPHEKTQIFFQCCAADSENLIFFLILHNCSCFLHSWPFLHFWLISGILSIFHARHFLLFSFYKNAPENFHSGLFTFFALSLSLSSFTNFQRNVFFSETVSKGSVDWIVLFGKNLLWTLNEVWLKEKMKK